jgi:hypothetical protein
MSGEGDSETDPAGWRSPALNYIALCGAALVVMLQVLLAQGYSVMVALVILLVGVLGVLTRMSVAPLAVLLAVAVSQLMRQLSGIEFRWRFEMEVRGTPVVSDLLLGVAVLAYTIGHYRLQGVSRHIFPPDQRLRQLHRYARLPAQSGAAPGIERKRAAQLVTSLELALLALSLPLWALLAQLVWYGLTTTRDVLARDVLARPDYAEWNPGLLRIIALLTGLVGSVLMVAAVLRHLRHRNLAHDEARLVMQDTLWNETRGEQRWIARWQTWFKLERKERP